MIALAAAAAFAGAAIQSATGFGFALLLSPALFAAVDPHAAVTALLALGLVLNLLVLADGGLAPAQTRALAPLLLAAVPGLVLGAGLLTWLSKPVLQVGVGAAVMAAAAVQWQARGRGPGQAASEPLERPRPASPRRAVWRLDASRESRGQTTAAFVGFTSGALTTSVSISGPPIMLWLEARGLRPAEIRSSLALVFLFLNLAGAIVVLATGGTGAIDLALLAGLLALVVAGHLLGAAAFGRLDQRAFSRIALALVALAGAASVAAGALAV